MTGLLVRLPPVEAPDSDATLLAAIARGDLGALGMLYDRHARAVWRTVHRVTNGGEGADDIVHAAFLKVVQIAHTFDGRASARAWVTGIAVRLALRQKRSARRFALMLARFATVMRSADTVDAETRSVGRERLAVLDRAIRELPAAQRAVFVLVELEGLSHDEVAEALEVPLPTVRTRLFYAKTALRAALPQGES